MAKLVANNALNMETINFASFAGGETTSLVYNKKEITIDFVGGDRHQFLGSFGINILARALSGTGTSWVYSNTLSHETFFSLTEAKIPATKAFKAGLTASTTDDHAVIADVFKGNDSIQGSSSADVLSGFKGNDTIGAGAGDVVNGGDTKDKDVITFADATGPVQITLVKGVSTAFLVGGAQGFVVNVESVVGGSLGDTITGDVDGNSLKGEGGEDLIDGGAGNDTVDGGSGNDTIIGGAGKDSLTGGLGDDTFKFLSVADYTKGEVITDFAPGDKIDLSAIDAMISASPGIDDAFVLDLVAGTNKSAVAEGHISWYVVDKPNPAQDRTYIRVNVDSNPKIDMTIELKGVFNLTAADFIL